MNIETSRLQIRPFLPTDDGDLQAILGDEETMKFCEPAYDLEKTRRFLTDFCIGSRGALAAVERSSGRVVGYILFKEYEPESWEMGWIFNRSCWGRGYAFESCKAVLNRAFEIGIARKIFAETVDPGKSVALMRRLGLRPAGEQDGMIVYELTREEWQHENRDL